MMKVASLLKNGFLSRTETILIAEPDETLRRLERRALSPKYQVLQASNAEEAVRIAARHQTPVDLLLTEVHFPNMHGWELTELLKLDYPDLKVVYLSSSLDTEVRAHTRPSAVVVLEKNRFRRSRLRQTVDDALETQNHSKAKATGILEPLFSPLRHDWG